MEKVKSISRFTAFGSNTTMPTGLSDILYIVFVLNISPILLEGASGERVGTAKNAAAAAAAVVVSELKYITLGRPRALRHIDPMCVVHGGATPRRNPPNLNIRTP